MKLVIISYILPFIISLATIYYAAQNKSVNNFFFDEPLQENLSVPDFRVIGNFLNNNNIYEEHFLKSGNKSEIIYLLGSSELTAVTGAIPYNFITERFTTKLKGVGHAGNQCLSIYTQLLANKERLENAPIIIILSPGWFESKAAKGTSSEIFLEFNSERFLHKILADKKPSEFHTYLYKRIAEMYTEFTSPGIELKLMNFYHLASKSFIHAGVYTPLILCDNVLMKSKEKISPQMKTTNASFKRIPVSSDTIIINWDSIYTASRKEVLSKVTNNHMGISDSYYTEYICGKIGQTEPVNEYFNQELEDFKMLTKLLNKTKVNASFIISPLNPFYYKNLKDILPTINTITAELKKNKFPYLNLLEPDTDKYDKAILHDVMHMSDYGWYKADKFIIDTYHLSK